MNISKLSVLLTGNIDGFAAAMTQAGRHTTELSHSLRESAVHVLEFAGGFAAFEVAKHAVEELAHGTTEAFHRIEESADLADALGIATEKMMGLQYAARIAGADASSLSGGLLHLASSVDEASHGTGSAAAAFGLLHLSAADLEKLPLDEQFKKVADGLNGMENATQRANAARDIFGKGVGELLQVLDLGSDGINKLQTEAEKTGNALNRMDAAKVQLATQSMRRLQGEVTGVENVLAVSFAPYIAAAADKLADLGMSGDGAAKLVVKGFHYAADAIAYLADGVNIAEGEWHGFKAVVIEGTADILDMLAKDAHFLDIILEKLGQKPTGLTEALRDMSASMHGQAADEFTKASDAFNKAFSGELHNKITGVFNAIEEGSNKAAKAIADAARKTGGTPLGLDEAGKKAEQVLDDLHKKLRQFGMTESQKLLDDLAKNTHDPAKLQDAQDTQAKLDALEEQSKAHKKLADDVTSMWDSAKSAEEKYNEKIDELNEAYQEGLLTLEQRDKIADKLAGDLDKKDKSHDDKAPELLAAGTAAAAHFISMVQHRGDDSQQQLVKGQDKGNGFLADIRDSIKDMASALGSDQGVSL